MNAKLNKRERKAAQLLAHYATCERLAAYLNPFAHDFDGNADGKCKRCGKRLFEHPKAFDGKKISVALWKIERDASDRSIDYCNGAITTERWEELKDLVKELVQETIGKLPPGFFVNSDPRGYALKIDNENPAGKALIEAVKLHTDWGGYGILSPEIDGD